MVDLQPTVETAQRLLKSYGREVTLVSFAGDPADPSEPWKGPANPRQGGAQLDVDAAFLDPASARRLGFTAMSEDAQKRYEQVAIVAPGVDVDLTVYEEILDAGRPWKIGDMEVLRPGSQTVVAFLGLTR